MNFPDLIPSSRSFELGQFPTKRHKMMTNETQSILTATSAFNAQLRLTYANRTPTEIAQFMAHYDDVQVQGTYKSFKFTDNWKETVWGGWSNPNGSKRLLAMSNRWRYAAPPRISQPKYGVATIEIVLKQVPGNQLDIPPGACRPEDVITDPGVPAGSVGSGSGGSGGSGGPGGGPSLRPPGPGEPLPGPDLPDIPGLPDDYIPPKNFVPPEGLPNTPNMPPAPGWPGGGLPDAPVPGSPHGIGGVDTFVGYPNDTTKRFYWKIRVHGYYITPSPHYSCSDGSKISTGLPRGSVGYTFEDVIATAIRVLTYRTSQKFVCGDEDRPGDGGYHFIIQVIKDGKWINCATSNKYFYRRSNGSVVLHSNDTRSKTSKNTFYGNSWYNYVPSYVELVEKEPTTGSLSCS